MFVKIATTLRFAEKSTPFQTLYRPLIIHAPFRGTRCIPTLHSAYPNVYAGNKRPVEKVYLFALQGVRPVVGFLVEGLP